MKSIRPVTFQLITASFIFILCAGDLAAQSSTRYQYNKMRLTYEQAIDSLNTVIGSYDSAYQLAVRAGRQKDSMLSLSGEEIRQQAGHISDLEAKVEQFRGKNLKLDQSNRILIIFNSIVGVLLLITLVWFLRNIGRKKNRKAAPEAPGANGIVAEKGEAGFEVLEHKLVQLERLSKLKEHGALTNEEFQQHKQQVLGNAK